MTENDIEQLIIDEGFKENAYKCTAGHNTIGMGYNLDANPLNISREKIKELRDNGITWKESRGYLVQMLEINEKECQRNFAWFNSLNDARKGVLLNMCYNMGIDKLKGFKNTLALIKARDFDGASKEMLNSAWANQVHDRAKRLALQMKTGEYHD